MTLKTLRSFTNLPHFHQLEIETDQNPIQFTSFN